MKYERKIEFLKKHGWSPVWCDRYWTNTEVSSDMGGLPIDEAYELAIRKSGSKF